MNYRDMTPDDVLALAAKGDEGAQSELVSYALGCGELGIETRFAALMGAEIFARMSASHGVPEERRKLAVVLLLRAQADINRGEEAEGRERQAEALAITSTLADEGCEVAAQSAQQMADALPADVVTLAAQKVRAASAPGTVH